MNTATKTKTDLQLRWLRLRRHLRSCSDSTRALRDAARVLSEPTPALFASAPSRDRLCRRSIDRLAA